MRRLLPIAVAISVLALGACAHSDRGVTKEEYQAEMSHAERDYREAQRKCDGYSGNAEDICRAAAKAQKAKDEARAEAHYKDTPGARFDERVATAEADYKVAQQRCDELAGDNKDVCQKDAKAAMARAKADARADYRTNRESQN